MSDRNSSLESLRARLLTSRKRHQESLANVDEQLSAVDLLLIQNRTESKQLDLDPAGKGRK